MISALGKSNHLPDGMGCDHRPTKHHSEGVLPLAVCLAALLVGVPGLGQYNIRTVEKL
jgi:hypothetical protein